MIDMIERVAMAISGAPFPSKASLRKARAAIEAMREPTEDMGKAAEDGMVYTQDLTFRQISKFAWRDMIDAALAEEKPE